MTQWHGGIVESDTLSRGTVEQRHNGAEAEWNGATAAQWTSGTVEQWYSETVAQFNSGKVAQSHRRTWSSGTDDEWFSETVPQCNSHDHAKAQRNGHTETVAQSHNTVDKMHGATVKHWHREQLYSEPVAQWNNSTVELRDRGTLEQ
ncbi:hypothetical protein ACROYT_G029378 [Oculina patagonica]